MLQNCSILKIAKVFFQEPTTAHYLKEISKKAQLAHTSVSKHLKELIKQDIIEVKSEKKGKRNFPVYHAKMNETFKRYKRIHNLYVFEDSKIIPYLKDNCMPRSMTLFGSFAKGEDTEDSDIDIFIESKEKPIKLEVYKRKLKRKIQLHFKENFNEYPKELKNNILNGIVFQGYREIFK